jgi:hypothetical protein
VCVLHSNATTLAKWAACKPVVILCFAEGPCLSVHHGDSEEKHKVIVNDNWEENSSKPGKQSQILWVDAEAEVQGVIKEGKLSSC